MYHINYHKQNKKHSKINVRKANSKVENLHKKIEYFFDLIISKKYIWMLSMSFILGTIKIA
jgi:hypothetical protein